MTLTAGPIIGFGDVNTEIGAASTANLGMDWIQSKTKPIGTVNSLNSLYSKTYYSNTMAGNCNNGNCTSNCNCGNKQCTNCIISGPVNCANCDGGVSYLQANCNCNCTYNCNYANTTYNCDCNCTVCACACSDPKLKHNIASIPNPLDILNKLDGKFYDWNKEAEAYGMFHPNGSGGLLADQVEKVLPNLVYEYNGAKSVVYEGIIGILVEAVKSLRKELNDIKGLK